MTWTNIMYGDNSTRWEDFADKSYISSIKHSPIDFERILEEYDKEVRT